VVTSCGHSYERGALLAAWAAAAAARPGTAGVRRDPVTNTQVTETITPNWILRKQVADWLQTHPGRVPEGWPDRNVPRLRADGTPVGPLDAAAAPGLDAAAATGGVAPRRRAGEGGGADDRQRVLAAALWLLAGAGAAAYASAAGLAHGGALFSVASATAALGATLALGGTQLLRDAARALAARLRRAGAGVAPALSSLRRAALHTAALFWALALGVPALETALLLAVQHALLPEGAAPLARPPWWRPVLFLQLALALRLAAQPHAPRQLAAAALQLAAAGPAHAALAGAQRWCIARASHPLLLLGALCPLEAVLTVLALLAAPVDKEERTRRAAVALCARLRAAARGSSRRALSLSALAALVATWQLALAPRAMRAAAAACAPTTLHTLRLAAGAEAAIPALHAAAAAGCASAVRALTPLPRSVLTSTRRGSTAAVTAASRGHADVLDALAEAGASLNALSPCGARPLHAAASHGHAAAAEAIVQRAPRATAGRDARGATPLAAAVAAGAASSATEGAIVPIVELLVVSYAADTSPDALSYDDMDAGLSLTALAAPRPALLDALVRARCAAAAAASAEGVNVGGARAAERALAALREELGAAQSTQRLPPRAAATLARLRRGARSCVDDDDT
jgi:hypothetical protein